MKLKYVLFSGLLLSVGFTACTNDDFTEAVAPVNTEDAISLGEGYTITVAKGNADTRAYMEDLQTAVWEETDTLGAAWYDMITDITANPDGTLTITNEPTKANSVNVYSTVRQFKWNSWAGDSKTAAVFKTGEDINAGAYMLYYPYSKGELSNTKTSLGVNLPAEQDMDCTTGNELKGVSKNIFAYAPVAFLEGGAQATENFTLNQLTNVLALQFKIEDQTLLGLLEKVNIAKVVIEAKDASGSVLTSEGSISVPEIVSYQNENYGKATFSSEKQAGQIILNVAGASDDYAIDKLGEDGMTKAFYISLLPFKAEATSFTVRILTDKDVVLKKEYAAGDVLDAINAQAYNKEGQLIKLNVTLEDLDDTKEIYVESQFKTQWEAALKSTKATTLNVKAELDLSDYDLNINAAAGDITITGAPVTVKSLTSDANTKLVIDNELTVEGDVNVGPHAALVSTGTNGVLNVEGKMDVTGTTGALTVGSVAELETALSGVITLNGATDGKSTLGNVNNAGSLTLGNTIAIAKDKTLTNTGELAVNGTLTNNGTLAQNGTMTTAATGKLVNNNAATFTKATGAAGSALNIDNSKGATLNIQLSSNDKTSNEARFAVKGDNKGTINVKKGFLTEDAVGEFKMSEAAARVYVEKDALIWLKGETGITNGWIVLNDKAANADLGTLASGYYNHVAYSIKKAEDLLTKETNEVFYQFIDADLKIAKETTFSVRTYFNASQTFAANVHAGSHVYINGNISFSGNNVEFDWTNPNGKLNFVGNSTLTLSKDFTLDLSNSDTDTNVYLNIVKNGGTVETE